MDGWKDGKSTWLMCTCTPSRAVSSCLKRTNVPVEAEKTVESIKGNVIRCDMEADPKWTQCHEICWKMDWKDFSQSTKFQCFDLDGTPTPSNVAGMKSDRRHTNSNVMSGHGPAVSWVPAVRPNGTDCKMKKPFNQCLHLCGISHFLVRQQTGLMSKRPSDVT